MVALGRRAAIIEALAAALVEDYLDSVQQPSEVPADSPLGDAREGDHHDPRRPDCPRDQRVLATTAVDVKHCRGDYCALSVQERDGRAAQPPAARLSRPNVLQCLTLGHGVKP